MTVVLPWPEAGAATNSAGQVVTPGRLRPEPAELALQRHHTADDQQRGRLETGRGDCGLQAREVTGDHLLGRRGTAADHRGGRRRRQPMGDELVADVAGRVTPM